MTDSWADKAIDDMKASYEAELSTLHTRIEELERERDNDDLPQAPWPASDWAVNRIAELEQKLERALGSLTRMTDIAEARLVMITDLESRLAEARAEALEVAAKEIERIAPTTESEEVLLPVTDDYGDVVGHFVERAGKRQRFITGDRAAAAIRALNGGANG